ncbi:hypothetical protein KY342_06165 [Candidatus Woesearchaeota archaeon]|nr:hypothetical protein [Candidatus Woesearchaeota archaeon]
MVKRIDQVLSRKELSQIIKIGYDIQSVYSATLLENVLHVVCENENDTINVELYPSLKNPYVLRIPSKKIQRIPRRQDAKELYERRERHKTEFSGRRWEIVLDEIRIRNHDIEVHKFYLSEEKVEDFDVGWIMVAAHWLKEHGTGFYDLSKKQHQDLGIDFEFKGMEKSVGIAAPNREGIETYYVVVRGEDFSPEEHYAQACGGVMKVLENGQLDVDVEKAAEIRTKIDELCDKYFCILGRKK